jgi:hypothetical protein
MWCFRPNVSYEMNMRNLLVILIFICHLAEAQNVKILSVTPTRDKNILQLELNFTNTSNQICRYYKVSNDDICTSIVSLKFTDIKKKTSFFYQPCDGLYQLDHIEFSEKNTVCLESGDSFKVLIKINKSKTPYLKKGNEYKIEVYVNLAEIPNPSTDMFTGNLEGVFTPYQIKY